MLHIVPVHEHIAIKQMWLISKRSSLTDVAKICKRSTEHFVQTTSTVHLLCVQYRKKCHCPYWCSLWFLTCVGNRNLYKNTSICLFLQRINTPRKQGGLGPMKIPLLSDLTHQISKDYGVYLEDQGHTLRYFTGFQFGWVFAGVILTALYLKRHLKFFF